MPNIKDFDKRTPLEIKVYAMYHELGVKGYTTRRIAELVTQYVLEKAATLHENINTACDHERLNGSPGAAAMGSIIQYRDEIRKLGSAS